MAAEDFWSCAGVDFSVSQTLKSFISWLLPERYMQPEETECYFFTPRKRKYKNGIRPIRSAGDGYWKATGADLEIKYRKKLVGWRKSLVFYLGTPPQGKKTNWIMHEFKLNKPPITKTDPDDMSLDKWVLCKVYENSRRSRHPACERYVDDDDDEDINPDPSTIPTFSGNILDVANDGEQEVKHDIHIIPTNMRNIHNAAALNGDQDTKSALSTGCVHNPNSTYPTIQPIYEIPLHHNPHMIGSQPPMLPVKSSQPHSISDAMPWQPHLMSDAMPWQPHSMSDAMTSQPHLTDSQLFSLSVVPPPSVNVQPQPFYGQPDISIPKFDTNHDPSTIPTSSGKTLGVGNDDEQDGKYDIHTIPTNMRYIHNAAAPNGDQDTKHALSTGCLHNPNYTYPTIQPIYEIPPHHNPTMISSQPPLPVKSSQPHSISDAMPWQPPLMSDAMPWQPPLMSDAMPWQANLMSDAMPSQPHSTLDAMPSESHLTDSQPLSLTVVPPPSVNVQPQPFDGLLPDISTLKFDLDDDNLDLFQNDPFWNDIFRDSDSPPPK